VMKMKKKQWLSIGPDIAVVFKQYDGRASLAISAPKNLRIVLHG